MCEVDPATLPVYNGIYDDEGNKVDLLSIPTPDLCLSCAKFLIDDWDENLLCDMNRADEREEGVLLHFFKIILYCFTAFYILVSQMCRK